MARAPKLKRLVSSEALVDNARQLLERMQRQQTALLRTPLPLPRRRKPSPSRRRRVPAESRPARDDERDEPVDRRLAASVPLLGPLYQRAIKRDTNPTPALLRLRPQQLAERARLDFIARSQRILERAITASRREEERGLPIADYHALGRRAIAPKLAELSLAELQELRRHELRGKNRVTVLRMIDRRISARVGATSTPR